MKIHTAPPACSFFLFCCYSLCVLHLYTIMQLLFLHILMSIYSLWIYFLSLHLLFNTIYWLSLCYTVIQHTTSLSWDYVIVQCTHYKKLTLAIHTFLQVQVLDFQPHLSLKPCMTGPWTLTLPIWAPCFHSSIYSKSAITAGWSLLGLKAQGLNPGAQAWEVGGCVCALYHNTMITHTWWAHCTYWTHYNLYKL